jgi:H+/Cl- antiporter ClcA
LLKNPVDLRVRCAASDASAPPLGAKMLVTCLTLGSGASGGVFSPAMFLGATFRGAFGVLAQAAIPEMPFTPTHFAYAGMAGTFLRELSWFSR